MENRLDRLAAPLFFFGALSLYLAYLTAQHSYDAVAGGILLYQWITSGEAAQLFHPYHILYLPFAALVDAALGKIGLAQDPLTLLQTLNTLFAAGAVALFYRVARKLSLDPLLSTALTTLFATIYCSWYYASNAEPYAPSIFFLMLAFLSALSLPAVANTARILRPGLWLGLAAGFHITCLLAAPALALAVWPGHNCEKPLRRPILALVAVAVVALAPYVASYLAFEEVDPFTGLTGELAATVDPGYRGKVWWSVDPRNLYQQWLGLGRAGTAAPVLQLSLLALTLLPLALLMPGRERARRLWMLLAWFFAAFVFFSTYNTASDKFAAYQWAPLLLLAGFGIRALEGIKPLRVAAVSVVAGLAVATAAFNLGVLREQADPQNNPHLARARAIAANSGPDDVVVHLGRGREPVPEGVHALFRRAPLDGARRLVRQDAAERSRDAAADGAAHRRAPAAEAAGAAPGGRRRADRRSPGVRAAARARARRPGAFLRELPPPGRRRTRRSGAPLVADAAGCLDRGRALTAASGGSGLLVLK